MKTIKTLLSLVLGASAMMGCLNNTDNYQAGFPLLATKYTYRYANNTRDTLLIMSYGRWSLERTSSGGEWCVPAIMQGNANTDYRVCFNFSQNSTGYQRSASFQIKDVEHANDAYANFSITQLATRGDGSLGNAPLVKKIAGTDGSLIEISYDEVCRPLTFKLSKNNTILNNLVFGYNDTQDIMTVTINGGRQLKASYANDYQPIESLGDDGEKIAYREQDYFNLTHSHYAFNIEHRLGNGTYSGYSYLLESASHLLPDKLHNADSLRYTSGKDKEVTETLAMKPTYSQNDNRCQSVDVNQLLLGVERCNPYMLLSLFRAARNTSIFDVVKVTGKPDIRFSTTLNGDKSVSELTVAQDNESITYTFTY